MAFTVGFLAFFLTNSQSGKVTYLVVTLRNTSIKVIRDPFKEFDQNVFEKML
jgi:hypothetical protein